jgi:hypothetical protein
MNVTLLKQTRNSNCGQVSFAMLTGKTIREAERIYGHGHATCKGEHIKALTRVGFYPDSRGFIGVTRREALPALALVRLGFLKRSGGHLSTSGKLKRTGHLVLWANGQFYDPAGKTYQELPNGVVVESVLEVLAP